MGSAFGDKLKEIRSRTGMTAEDVSMRLKENGFEIAGKTISGYETGKRMPNADVFMALMTIYKCQNPLNEFSFVEVDYTIPSDDEWEMIEKYRLLDDFGRDTINIALERETQRIEQLKNMENKAQITIPNRIINYYYRLASAGTGQIIFDMPPSKKIEIPNIPKYKKVDYAIGVNGNSMEPVFSDGDILLVEMTNNIDVGEIGIFTVDEECYVKKLGQGELISLNPDYNNIPLDETARCMGKVLDKYEK